MDNPQSTQIIRTELLIGVPLDEFDFRLLLREYHRELRRRFPRRDLPAYSPERVLNSLIPRFEADASQDLAGSRRDVLQAFAQRHFHLDLTVAGSDYGPHEKRRSPYGFNRCFYHLGRSLVSASLRLDAPGFTPYCSTRRWSPAFLRQHLDEVMELVPDYLWWAMHQQRDVLRNCLLPEQVAELQRQLQSAGFKTDNIGLFLTTHECLFEELPNDRAATAQAHSNPIASLTPPSPKSGSPS